MATILDTKFSDDERPYVTITIDGININGLLDSGAALTLIGEDVSRILLRNNYTLMTDNINIQVANGQTLKTLGYINLPIAFDNQVHIIKGYVVPEVQPSLILGIDFWRQFRLCPKYLGSLQIATNHDESNNINPSKIQSYQNLNLSQKLIADDVIEQYKNISFERKGLGRTHLIKHRINTGDSPPIRQRYYRLSPEKQQILVQQLDEMLSLDVVEPCESAWQSPVLIVNKKDGKPRFCLDSRKLNSVTLKDAYNLPYISEILDNLRDARFLTSLDLSKSYWQIELVESDRDKTAFYIPGRGTFRFKTMPFGLTNAPATQQRLVDALFSNVESKVESREEHTSKSNVESRVFAYLDDVIIISSTFEEHVTLLKNVLKKLQDANLTINLDKCQFFRSELKYLGYVVDSNGLHTDPAKVEAIINYKTPSTKKEVKRFLGTASWYRRFVPNFSNIAGPLNKLTSTKKNAPPFKWTEEANQAFETLKERLITAPVLTCPNFNLPFEVHTDVSSYGIGAMLTQTVDGKENPVAYMSRSLTQPEKNYSVTERETLAVIVALENWRCYLENGKPFTVYTDHSALKWFLSLNNPTGRLARWSMRLSSFNCIIKHKKGSDNVIPDALSRAMPVNSISTANSLNTTNDTWYSNIYNNCMKKPHKFPNYTIKNNILYRLSKNKCRLTSEFNWKEVVPAELRESIIKDHHDKPTDGHLGIFKTYHRITLRYYWPGMYKDVTKFVTACPICLQYKHQNHQLLGEMGRPKHCKRPFQFLSIDLIGPLPLTRKQNAYILVVTCCFSKFCHIFPIRKAIATNINKIIEEQIFLVHGIPQTILMDNGQQFVSNETTQLFQKYNVPNVYYTPKYTPQVNTVERYNKTIVTCLSMFVQNDQRTWDTFIPSIQFAINNSVNETTGYTPSFLVFGRELIICGSHYINNDTDKEIVFSPRDQYAENLGAMSQIFDKVQTTLYQAHVKNANRYNLRRKFYEFNVGDVVYKKTYVLSDKDKYFSKKLAPKYTKCTVIEKRSPLVYVLEDSNGKNIGSWHIKDLKIPAAST